MRAPRASSKYEPYEPYLRPAIIPKLFPHPACTIPRPSRRLSTLSTSNPSPLPGTPTPRHRIPIPRRALPLPLLALLLRIQHKTQHIERELRKLQTHPPKAPLRLMPQYMTPLAPKARHRIPDRGVRPIRMAVHIPRIRQLRHRCTIHQMDLTQRKGAQGRHAEFLS